MTDPGKQRKFTVIDLILILLFIIMIYALYILFGGDLTALFRPETYTVGESPFDKLVGSLSAFGRSLRDSFGGIMR